jgi:hypothetical protein
LEEQDDNDIIEKRQILEMGRTIFDVIKKLRERAFVLDQYGNISFDIQNEEIKSAIEDFTTYYITRNPESMQKLKRIPDAPEKQRILKYMAETFASLNGIDCGNIRAQD